MLGGLFFFGAALGLALEASLGVDPWTVFHGGVSELTGLTIGTITVITGLFLLVTYPLYNEPMGLGTLLNVILIGPVIDLTLWVMPDITGMPLRVAALATSTVLLGLGSGLYIGAGLGPGPRDGLMTALSRRKLPVWLSRLIIELSVLTIGWFLGGDVGWGTLWMAVSIGFFVDFFLRRLRIDD